MSTRREYKSETVMNWNGELSPQEYAAALSPSPAAKWYVDLCERVERERYEESQRALSQSLFAPWRGPPRPNLRDNPLTPDLDARELELARGLPIESLTDTIDRVAGAFGLVAERMRDAYDAVLRSTQISLGYTVIPEAPAWSTEYQAVPTEPALSEPWIMPTAAQHRNWQYRELQAQIESDAEYRARAQALLPRIRSPLAGLRLSPDGYRSLTQTMETLSDSLQNIADVEVEGKW